MPHMVDEEAKEAPDQARHENGGETFINTTTKDPPGPEPDSPNDTPSLPQKKYPVKAIFLLTAA